MYQYPNAVFGEDRETLFEKLYVKSSRIEQLETAQTFVRKAYFEAFSNIGNVKYDAVLGIGTLRAAFKKSRPFGVYFRGQGSSVYDTLNCRYYEKYQKIDYDDGLFITLTNPVEGDMPSVDSSTLFNFLDFIANAICVLMPWTFVRKGSCIRFEIDRFCQVDLATYAIHRYDFKTRTEEPGNQVQVPEFKNRSYSQMSLRYTYLAHRSDGWVRSHPRAIEDWFNTAVASHGPRLVRLCRYVKAWRDATWRTGGPSSIALMAATVSACNQLNEPLSNYREDEAISQISRLLPSIFEGSIPNPDSGCPDLNLHWSEKQRKDYVDAAKEFFDAIRLSLSSHMFNHKNVQDTVAGVFGGNRKIASHLIEAV